MLQYIYLNMNFYKNKHITSSLTGTNIMQHAPKKEDNMTEKEEIIVSGT